MSPAYSPCLASHVSSACPWRGNLHQPCGCPILRYIVGSLFQPNRWGLQAQSSVALLFGGLLEPRRSLPQSNSSLRAPRSAPFQMSEQRIRSQAHHPFLQAERRMGLPLDIQRAHYRIRVSVAKDRPAPGNHSIVTSRLTAFCCLLALDNLFSSRYLLPLGRDWRGCT